MIIGIGAKPAVSPFETVGLNKDVGGIQVRLMCNIFLADGFKLLSYV